jgi:RNA polymerase sigma-70 factor (ECF subfamily)
MDQQRAGELYLEHYRELVAAQRRLLGSTPDAEDAVQEAFTAALAHRDDDLGRAWLHLVGRRRSADELRRRRRSGSALQRFAATSAPMTGTDPADAVADRDEARAAALVIAAMPPMTRRVVEHLAAGRDPAEIARDLGLSDRAVESHRQRARVAVRRFLRRSAAVGIALWGWTAARRRATVATVAAAGCAAVTFLLLPHMLGAPRPRAPAAIRPPSLAGTPSHPAAPSRATTRPWAAPTPAPRAGPLRRTQASGVRSRPGPGDRTPAGRTALHVPLPAGGGVTLTQVDNGGYQGPVEAITWCLDHFSLSMAKVGC